MSYDKRIEKEIKHLISTASHRIEKNCLKERHWSNKDGWAASNGKSKAETFSICSRCLKAIQIVQSSTTPEQENPRPRNASETFEEN